MRKSNKLNIKLKCTYDTELNIKKKEEKKMKLDTKMKWTEHTTGSLFSPSMHKSGWFWWGNGSVSWCDTNLVCGCC